MLKSEVSTFYSDQGPHVVQVALHMTARDWYALENSRQWSELQSFYDGLQKQCSHCTHREDLGL